MAQQYPWRPWTTDLAVREDGQRVALADNTFEWWYFDAMMDDGSTCVLNFLSKPPFVNGPPMPVLQFNISTPVWDRLQSVALMPANTYSAASDRCAVTMGKSSVMGDLHTYMIHAEGAAEDGTPMQADLTLRRVVPGWRTGPYLTPDEAATIFLGEQVVIPSGTVEGTLSYGGASYNVRGNCYHDHQWGGIGVPGAADVVLKYWYWGRVQAGDHAVAVAQVYGSVNNGPVEPVTTLWTYARGTAMTYDDTVGAVTVTPKDVSEGVPGTLDIVWTPGAAPGTSAPLLGSVRFSLHSAQKIADFGPEYVRFVCPSTLTSDFAGESFSIDGRAIWEIMHLPK